MNRTKGKSQRKGAPKSAGTKQLAGPGNGSGSAGPAAVQASAVEPTSSKSTSRKMSNRSGKSGTKFKDVTAKVDTGRVLETKLTGGMKPANIPDGTGPAKMERSNSFFLTRKISQIYSKFSGSRESLGMPDEETQKPFTFKRSLSLSTIQINRNTRRVQNESNLRKLHEEAILEHAESGEEPLVNIPKTPETPKVEIPKLERSNSILASFRRKISFRSDKKPKLPTKWNTSLQNLRQEDFMVSYDDLSFVDYDQFNQYEATLERRLSSSQFDLSPKLPNPPASPSVSFPVVEVVNPTVIKRRQKTDLDLRRKTLVRRSFDFETNLDQDKNLYRNSIDGDKLRILGKVNRKSFRWSADVERDVDALNLDSLDQLGTGASGGAIVVGSMRPLAPHNRVNSDGFDERSIDVCDSGVIDGENGGDEESYKSDKKKRTSVSDGYVSRNQSLKRSRSCNDGLEASPRGGRLLLEQVSFLASLVVPCIVHCA
ncbi:uncharacterized protein LOC129742654 [Uranotaenia lowii]|uniref:uncharacterized protein LOC129742654 n=1 Tax=Uranotaenia lowii TaxID=190385 RepID=UPI00247A9616|nr:uncharacterized protein LOC129742654 [Uranotaenia lowii]